MCENPLQAGETNLEELLLASGLAGPRKPGSTAAPSRPAEPKSKPRPVTPKVCRYPS